MSEVNLPRRRIYALGHVDEMVDQLFHLRQHALLGRQRDLAVRHIDRPARQLVEALVHDPHALTQLLHPHQVAIVAVAPGANRHLELQLVIHQIGMRLAKIMIHPATAQVRAG